MRADRLLRMMLLLQKNKQMRAQDLSAELEVSLSTIYRDIDALSIAGIPVYTQPGTNGGIFIDEGFRTSLTDLSQSQIMSLFLAINAKTLADIGMEELTKDALLKLFSTLPTSHQNEVRRAQQRLYIDPEGWIDAEDTSHHLDLIQQAVWQDQRLQLVYQPFDRTPYDLKIDAYALVSKAYHWYLVGRKATGEFRTYRLSRIIHIQLCDEIFERNLSFDLARYWQSSQQHFQQQMADEFPAFSAELWVHTTAYWYLVRVLEGQFQQIGPPDDHHWCRIRIQFNSEYEAQAHILAMANRVKIVSPTHLKDDMKQVMKAVGAHYGCL
ncbi:MAG: WYL domain-containing protein [Ardenticatenaceae bacterium]|nr:WYL domain-containing protein [Ardenticatenaceae bacterium]